MMFLDEFGKLYNQGDDRGPIVLGRVKEGRSRIWIPGIGIIKRTVMVVL